MKKKETRTKAKSGKALKLTAIVLLLSSLGCGLNPGKVNTSASGKTITSWGSDSDASGNASAPQASAANANGNALSSCSFLSPNLYSTNTTNRISASIRVGAQLNVNYVVYSITDSDKNTTSLGSSSTAPYQISLYGDDFPTGAATLTAHVMERNGTSHMSLCSVSINLTRIP